MLHSASSDERLRYFGEQLGIVEYGLFMLEAEYEIVILHDFVIYGYFRDRGRLIDDFVDAKLEKNDLSDEARQLLEVKRNARFGIFEVERVVPGLGMYLRGYISGDVIFYVDLHFSQTATPGMLLVNRLVKPADWYMSTGAGFPIEEWVIKQLPARIRSAYKQKAGQLHALPPAARRGFECGLLRIAHDEGLTRMMRSG